MFHAARVRRLVATAFLLVFCLPSLGCGKSKITKANFDKINKGMTLEEVQAILGKGTKEEGDATNVAAQFGVNLESGAGRGHPQTVYVWETVKGDKSIKILFINDKVQEKIPSGL